ncbi:MAG: 4-hydroxy-tetrahydrodipicolinate synthase [Flavobacteriales bacterium]
MPPKNLLFRGTGVAIVTPFDVQGNIDFKALEKLVNHLCNNKVEYLVVLGTTGESVTLEKEEKLELLEAVKQFNNNRAGLVLGLGGNNTKALLKEANDYNLKGVDAILSVSPYYNKPSQEGIYQHYKTLAESFTLPIILYNVPGRSGSNMTAETQLRLAHDFKNIIGTKEASGNLEQIMQIIKDKPSDFLVISGDDALTLPIIAAGGDGVISVVANAYPDRVGDMVRLALNNEMEKARKLHYSLLDFIKYLFADGSPSGIKAALKIMDICEEHVRQPLANVKPEIFEHINLQIRKIKK